MSGGIMAGAGAAELKSLGQWIANGARPSADAEELRRALQSVREPFYLVRTQAGLAAARGGEARFGGASGAAGWGAAEESYPLAAFVPATPPEQLGDASFRADHGLKYAYVAGAMANGIASEAVVEAMARAGMLGFFGAAGLPTRRVEQAVDRIQASLGSGPGALPHGFNLIHSPGEPALEEGAVALYLRRGVRLVEASAYLRLTLPVVRYRLHGIHRDGSGRVVAPNKIIAKVSRIEVAQRFFSPPPEALVKKLVEAGEITEEQARMAEEIPMARDLTAEADSGGHTDNQPFVTLLPTMLALRDELQAKYGYADRLRVGAAGGIGTPAAAAAAFAMGAAYILTGSVNQACVESGTSDLVRKMLADSRQADVTMAPAADMFEMGVKVQVLKRGTMFAMRGAKLYELYRAHGSLEEIPAAARETLEKDLFQASVEDIWAKTKSFFAERDPKQLERAERDPKHKMALVFRWYLGLSSSWANAGEPGRQVDFQIWCGPAMGAFNEWTRGTFLEKAEARTVAAVARNLLHGAAVLSRAAALRAQGIDLPEAATRALPMTETELKEVG